MLTAAYATPVKAWLAEHTDAIEVLYLRIYSPEANPDETANADIKQAVTTPALREQRFSGSRPPPATCAACNSDTQLP